MRTMQLIEEYIAARTTEELTGLCGEVCNLSANPELEIGPVTRRALLAVAHSGAHEIFLRISPKERDKLEELWRHLRREDAAKANDKSVQ